MNTSRALLLALSALPGCALAGCALVDQTTFNPDAGKRPEVARLSSAAPLAPETGRPALLSIRLPLPAGLRPEIARAVAAARARKPQVAFDVVEITPDAGPGVGQDAAEIARLLVAEGIPAARVAIAARPIPNVPREVRVYVR